MEKVNKNTEEYLIEQIDKAVNELVFPKYKLQKAYNYYNGIRDAEQFRHLEENFGIGNPTSIEFTPLIKKHVDALIGEYLNTPILPKVSCKDSKTLSNIQRDKNLKIVNEVFNYLNNHLHNSLVAFVDGKTNTDTSIQHDIDNIKEDIETNFISEYEIASQNIIEYIMQSRQINLIEKLKQLLLDLIVTGTCYYRVRPTKNKNNIDIEVYNPLNTFIDRNPESNFIKDSYRIVVRKWMTKTQILNKYGEDLDKDSLEELEGIFEGQFDTAQYYIRSFNNQPTGYPMTDGINAGQEVVPGFPSDEYRVYSNKLIPVYEVEYITSNKSKKGYDNDNYKGIRMGQSIYVTYGKDENIVRSIDDPSMCCCSTNGLLFNNRGTEAYSLVLACANLQDKYDILHFYRDSIIANSGTTGDWLDLSMLPTKLGVDLPERIQKFIAYKKAGVALVDTSQEGRAFNNNTTFAGFDDTVKAQTIQGIQISIESIESTCSSITGVFRERLNGIQQHDAVTNVKVGVQNSFIITKQYYHQMDMVTTEILSDALNIAKIVYKKGITGTLILGDKLQKVFTALPEHFTVSDFDVHLTSSSDVIKDLETIKQITFELVKNNNVETDIIIEALTSKSLTGLKTSVNKSLKKKKAENNMIQQLQQKLEETVNQSKQLAETNNQLQSEIKSITNNNQQLEMQKMQMLDKLEWFKARAEKTYKDKVNEINEKKVEIEYAQLYDNNPNNNEVKF